MRGESPGAFRGCRLFSAAAAGSPAAHDDKFSHYGVETPATVEKKRGNRAAGNVAAGSRGADMLGALDREGSTLERERGIAVRSVFSV